MAPEIGPKSFGGFEKRTSGPRKQHGDLITDRRADGNRFDVVLAVLDEV